MAIVSLIKSAIKQVDGVFSVHEQHTINGVTIDRIWAAPANWSEVDIDSACQLYGQRLADEDTRRQEITQAVYGSDLPVIWPDFIRRFTSDERKLIRAREAINPDTADGLDLAREDRYIWTSSTKVRALLNVLVMLGDLQSHRVDEVLNG